MEIKVQDGISRAVETEAKEPFIENCEYGTVPETYEVRKTGKIRLPVVTSMTKELFSRHRLELYSFLNRSLRSGALQETTGFRILNRVINKDACEFSEVTYRRIDRLNAYADIRVRLHLVTDCGSRDWNGFLVCWISAEGPSGLSFKVEELCSPGELDHSDLRLMSPFLIPYLTNADTEDETERIWREYLPDALDDAGKRNPAALAGAMGLSVIYLPLQDHSTVNSILFLIEDTVRTEDVPARRSGEVTVPADTVVINTVNVRRDFSAFSIYHEIVHYYEHYMFFRLQQFSANDITKMKTETVTFDGELPENPVFWTEKQACRGAYGLMLPRTDFIRRYETGIKRVSSYRHSGDLHEAVCVRLSGETGVPDFRIRTRAVQMGYIHAKGAVNYINRVKIRPFSFDADSLRTEGLTFVIDRETAGRLYAENRDFHELLHSGRYVYSEGHIVRNSDRFVSDAGGPLKLTDWAIANVDRCCLRFVRVFTDLNAGRYVYGRMFYDADYVRRTAFYLRDILNSSEIDELDAREIFENELPRTFGDAVSFLIRKNSMTKEEVADRMYIDVKTLSRRLSSPDTRITADFVIWLSLILQLPDWITDLLLRKAHIQLDEDDRRHRALRYIQRVMWMDGTEKANSWLRSRKLQELNIN